MNAYTTVHSFFGHLSILLGLASAAYGGIVGFGAGIMHSDRGRRHAERAAYAFAAFMVLANAIMVRALVVHDFSVKYVAQVGSRATPLLFTIVSLWSSLEGSILFWGAILGVYIASFTWLERRRHALYMPYALGTVLTVAAFFAFLIAAPADPFATLNPVPADGPGPNALLQNHALMIIHPPMLYLGYVGMAVPFAVAVAALLRGQLSAGWLKVLRRSTMTPWLFLSVGIILGGWWAYEVLGWGGYWAWDPVENASFLPWLAATAYLHSTVVQERKGILKAWTLALVLGAFLLTILGTFMTRSGVFNSVHSFTQSSIGPIFLGFLAVLVVFCIVLLTLRAHVLEDDGRIQAALSRESAFLVNNLLFAVFTFTVLLGTVFPLVTEAVRGVKVSVGEPYFNRMAVPIGLMLVFLMGVGPVLPWGRPRLRILARDFMLPIATALVTFGVLWLVLDKKDPLALATFALCGFAAAVQVRELIQPGLVRAAQRGDGALSSIWRSLQGNRRRSGGFVVHLGIIAIAAAIAGSAHYRQMGEKSLAVGESMQLGDYTLTLQEVSADKEEHRVAVIAHVQVSQNGKELRSMSPRLNYYPSQREPVGTPHVVTLGQTDLYLSMLSFEKDGSHAAIRAYVIPMVPWIWWSIPALVIGSVISLWPRRRSTDVVTG